ncbi:Alpha/Beta hydrolase protein [Mucor mucedo]|uniref:Alpha/Beta hydrolase protein n=1 Tax=Mucor mucedo TaxID=29922 RepID=UPI002220AB2F|nr:Alpha/Beta hydrolase protein [Mucor mucedo]KAI7896402.1 Alpha/Beta hydrolase protein [Mucor mucedo]
MLRSHFLERMYKYITTTDLLTHISVMIMSSKLIVLIQTLTPKKQTDEKIKSILYPGRITLVSTDTFFSNPKAIIQQKINHVEQIKQQSHCGKITPHYMAPREPIVLCHGLFGFDIRGPQNIPALQFHYWSGVEETLAKLGAKVIVTRVPQAGSIWERSHALHTILKSILVGKNVNFVAHSMGGLDCRHLLANTQDRPYHVQSLTTICTPHRGSPVMDWVRDHVGVGLSQSHNGLHQNSNWSPATTTISTKNNTLRHDADCLPAIDKLVVNWFDEPAYAHLTTDFCNDYFNPNTPDDPSVKYYSYGAAAQLPAWSSLLGLPWRMVQEKEGDNDGFVSVNSAKWGTYVKTINADHWDLSGKSHIPYRLRTSGQEFDRLDFYAEMATHLYNQGH